MIGKCSSYAPLAYPVSSAFQNNKSCQGRLEEWQTYAAAYVLHIKSWKMTEIACQEIAQGIMIILSLLNELKLLHKDESKAAQLAQHIIYMLSEECGKQRATGYQQCPVRWRLIALSTGKWNFGQHAENGSIELLGREQVRFVDVPANNENGYGMCATLPEGLSGGEFAEMLQDNCSCYHGTASQTFVSKLLSKNNKLMSKKSTQLVNESLKYHDSEKVMMVSKDGSQLVSLWRMPQAYWLLISAYCLSRKKML